ncbi:MAG: hypothetical protein ACOYXB_17305 [Bacteroidota bacterium]
MVREFPDILNILTAFDPVYLFREKGYRNLGDQQRKKNCKKQIVSLQMVEAISFN